MHSKEKINFLLTFFSYGGVKMETLLSLITLFLSLVYVTPMIANVQSENQIDQM